MEVVAAIVFGIAAGVLAGLIPGLHPNLFASLALTYFAGLDPLLLAVFLLCSGIANSFVSFIPSIFLGAPESESSLSVLPGHRMLRKGRGYEAVYLTVAGGVLGGVLVFLLFPFLSLARLWYRNARALIALGLILISCYMLFTEKGARNKLVAFTVFLCSGAMGMKFLSYGNEIFFPVFTGFFGLPLLFLSWKNEAKFPEKICFETEGKIEFSGVATGLLAGVLAGLFPGIGSAQASAVAQEVLRKKGDREFLISVGAITTVDVILSIFAIYFTGNPRSGIAQAVMQTLGNFSFEILLFLSGVSMCAIFLSGYITLRLSRIVIFSLAKLDYSKLSRNVFFALLALVAWFSGIKGLLLCLSSFFLGLFANLAGVKRTHLMGFLIIPTIFVYLGV